MFLDWINLGRIDESRSGRGLTLSAATRVTQGPIKKARQMSRLKITTKGGWRNALKRKASVHHQFLMKHLVCQPPAQTCLGQMRGVMTEERITLTKKALHRPFSEIV